MTTQPPTRILIIDDCYSCGMVLETILQSAGYDTCRSYNIEDGLATFLETNPKLIISDLCFGREIDEGLVLDEKLQALESDKPIPILYITLCKDRSVIDKIVTMKRNRPIAVLFKPVNRFDLLRYVNKLLNPKEVEKDATKVPTEI
jgi:DNA-binding NtrC family response regulator